MDYFSSVWFKIGLPLFVFFVIYGVVIFLIRNRIRKYVFKMTDEKRFKLLRSFSRTMPIYKILFWASPIYLIFIPWVIYEHVNDKFYMVATTVVIMYVAVGVGYLCSKIILQAADNGKRETI